jgi:hypothetical protein
VCLTWRRQCLETSDRNGCVFMGDIAAGSEDSDEGPGMSISNIRAGNNGKKLLQARQCRDRRTFIYERHAF